MQINITINMDNAAFEDINGCEVARILRELSEELDDLTLRPTGARRLCDINGNTVGHAIVVED